MALELYGENDRQVANCQFKIGYLLNKQSKYDEAMEAYKKGLEIFKIVY